MHVFVFCGDGGVCVWGGGGGEGGPPQKNEKIF